MSKEWITIFDNNGFIVDYNEIDNKYRVSYFEDNHFVDECRFDAPIKHGEWNIVYVDTRHIDIEMMYKCSVCGSRKYNDYLYCPNCGARMDGGKVI